MGSDVAFVSVAFGDKRYIEQIHRLKNSLKQHEPESTFFHWIDQFPPDSKKMAASLYGFKVHAVKYAMNIGFKKIIWLDPACILQKPVDYYFEIVKEVGVVSAKDDNLLIKHICDKALDYYGHPDTTFMHLVGGSIYVFDFDLALCETIYRDWEKAEQDGMFGSQVEAAQGKIDRHRNDESCMAMALYRNGSYPLSCDVCKYNNGEESIIIKKHFK